MNPKNAIYRLLAGERAKILKHETSHPKKYQEQIFGRLILNLKKTKFGQDHKAEYISDYLDYQSQIKIGGFEDLKPWITRILEGELNVLWPGKPLYFGLTSGTTSGTKLIPINQNLIRNQSDAGISAVFNYINEARDPSCLSGKALHIQANPKLDMQNGFPIGPFSGIAAHHFPKFFSYKKLPTQEINCIQDWNKKLHLIVEQSLKKPISILGGVTSWILMYMEELLKIKGVDRLEEAMPTLKLILHGGVSYDPYAFRFEKITGNSIDKIELYSATEGFIAFQDKIENNGLLLLPNNGIFFEFIRSCDFSSSRCETYLIEQLELNEEYVPIISTDSGLWRYLLGDTVKFVSRNPYRLLVTGRLNQFISTFGEHVIEEDTQKALTIACHKNKCSVIEYSVAPFFGNKQSQSHHEWFIEFMNRPENSERFRLDLEQEMHNSNLYYKNLVQGSVLSPLRINVLKPGSFKNLLISKGKQSGQNKVIHVCNDRNFVDQLKKFILEEVNVE